jgi:Lrp/AsnC family transcriptional regulator, leucine-responsive regulatory protein
MDDKDRLLLTLLRRDARRPIVALARDLGLSRSATQERLAKLQASGAIAGFTVVEGVEPAARQSAYLTVRFAPGRRCAQVVPKLKAIPHIGLIHSVTGPIDLIVRVDAESVAAIERSRAAIAAADGVSEVSTYVVLERHLG